MANTVPGIHLGLDTHANRPAANTVPDASFYSCSTHGLVYKSNFAGNSWATWGDLSGAHAARGTRTTTQSIATATWTGVQFDVADTYDTDAIHDPSSQNTRFVLNKLGIWSVKLRVQFAANATNSRYLGIFKNGSQYGEVYRELGNGTIGNYLVFADDVQATAITDYIECMVHQDSGGNLNLQAGSQCAVAFLGIA